MSRRGVSRPPVKAVCRAIMAVESGVDMVRLEPALVRGRLGEGVSICVLARNGLKVCPARWTVPGRGLFQEAENAEPDHRQGEKREEFVLALALFEMHELRRTPPARRLRS